MFIAMLLFRCTNYFLKLIVKETNRYAEQSNVGVESKSLSTTRKHQQSWMPLTIGEIKCLLGRTSYTNSYYTNVLSAEELLDKSTNLCGTLKVNRRFLPIVAKLKQKRDKRSVGMLTTCNNLTCTIIEGTSRKLKADAILEYNNAKQGLDISGKIASYYNSLRKTVKWYRKIIIELICATSIANAWYIYQKWGTKHFDVLQFRENSIDPLLDGMPTEPLNLNPKRGTAHFLQKYPGTARKSRKRCRECYKSLSARRGRTIASKKSKRVTAFCRFCEGEQPLCLECFKKNPQ
uniref:PiggyBac transposable element-derived protein domain-containing protein n=1 Tax=Glossina palpalis gambiensis TaxID=67801 RepID=A0A1B0C0L7_9MUSC